MTQSEQGQIHFTGESSCKEFSPNQFRKNFCITCQGKIQQHFTAKPEHIAAALEYSVDKVPSRVWSRGDDKCHLYVGGFKSSLNISFLKEHSIGLIVNAAYLLDRLYPPSTKIYQEFEKRRNSKDLEHIEELFVNWLDDPKQVIKSSILKDILNKINDCIFEKGHSCLVHCAQGKSRSVAIAISFIALSENISIDNALENVQRYRKMADPNPGFIDQLHSFERNDVFKEFKNSDLVKNST